MIYTLTLNPAVDKEYAVPQLVLDEVLRATAVRVDYGGKGFNVSRMLSGLGVQTVALGLVGGQAGRLLQDGLESLGIRTDFVWVAGETRTNVSIVAEADAGGQGHYVKANEAGPSVSAAETGQLLAKIQGLVQPGDWWVLSGSLPPGMAPDIYARIIPIVQAGGAKTLLDTSGQPLRLGCQAQPFLVKPNASEAAQLTGQPVDNLAELARAACLIHDLGSVQVVISNGKDGALASDGRGQWYGQAPAIEEANPIGAGDAMVAGLVWRLAMGEPVQSALLWGIACGAATASQPGTGMGSLSLVEILVGKIKLEDIGHAL